MIQCWSVWSICSRGPQALLMQLLFDQPGNGTWTAVTKPNSKFCLAPTLRLMRTRVSQADTAWTSSLFLRLPADGQLVPLKRSRVCAKIKHAGVPELPQAAVACILQHVPPQQRLTVCALVCRAWAAAAISVPAAVEADVSNDHRRHQLHTWLGSVGGHVTSLDLYSQIGTYPVIQLVAEQLQQLQRLLLHGVRFQLQLQQPRTRSSSSKALALFALGSAGNSSSGAAAVSLLPKLQELELANCAVPEPLLTNWQVPTLTKLQLRYLLVEHANKREWCGPERSAAAISQLLQQLPELSELELHQNWCGSEALSPLPSLARLERLSISVDPETFDVLDASVALPASLTHLEMSGLATSPEDTMRQGVCFSSLSHLQYLDIHFISLRPQVLRGLTSLQHLELSSLHKQWQQQQGQQGYTAADLLEVLQGFTQLRHLQLHDCGLYTVWNPPPALPYLLDLYGNDEQQQQAVRDDHQLQMARWQQQCALFSALTVSTQLTALHITQSSTIPLPASKALHYMFPAGRVFETLKVLVLERCTTSLSATIVYPDNLIDILRCCPALERLSLVNVGPDTDTTADNINRCLEVLPNTIQSLSFTPILGFGAASFLARLPTLQDLMCSCSNDNRLEMLTLLKGLTSLQVTLMRSDRFGAGAEVMIKNSQEWQEPDVWQQLQQMLSGPENA